MKERGHALSSEARTSTYVLGALPIVAGALMYFTSPSYIGLLFTEPTGHMLLGAAALSLATGMGAMRFIIPQDPVVNPLLLIPLAALSAGILILAAWLMLRVSNKDEVLVYRVGAARGQWRQVDPAEAAPRGSIFQPVHRLLAGIGRAVLESGLLPGRTRLELQHTLSGSGFRGSSALALFLGAKLVLLLTLPVVAWFWGDWLELAYSTHLIVTGIGFVAGLLAPDTIVRRTRAGYLRRLEDGLPDALDLLVICAQAGLSLEPAMSRVAAEMRLARPEVCIELEQTVRELEIMADAQAALGNLRSAHRPADSAAPRVDAGANLAVRHSADRRAPQPFGGSTSTGTHAVRSPCGTALGDPHLADDPFHPALRVHCRWRSSRDSSYEDLCELTYKRPTAGAFDSV